MSEITAPILDPQRPQPRKLRSRSYAAQVVFDTFGERSAVLGLAWIGLIAFCAVFCPVLASSHPFILKMNDQWSSPWLRHLEPVDVILLVSFVNLVVLILIRKLDLSQKVGIFIWLLAILIPLTCWPTVVQSWSGWADPKAAWKLWVAMSFVSLVDLGVIALMAWIVHLSARARMICIGVAIVYAVLFSVFQVRPPQAIVFEKYRDLAREGKVQFAIYAPIPYSSTDRLRDYSNTRKQPPSPTKWFAKPGQIAAPDSGTFHWLGTDVDGADVLSQMISATRVAMAIGFISTGIALAIGITLGALMGYYSGWVDLLGMRLVDIFNAIPTLPLLLTIIAFYGRSFYLIMAVIGFLGWTGYAVNVRAEFLKLRKQDFVQAAIACGLPLRSILFRHMLINGVTPVLVFASFGIASAIFTESTLSFLGLGPLDSASWGELLNQAVNSVGGFAWWLAIFPGVSIFLTVMSYNLIGESLRDAIDPHLKKASSL